MKGNKRSEAKIDKRDGYMGDVNSVEFTMSELKWTSKSVGNTELNCYFP